MNNTYTSLQSCIACNYVDQSELRISTDTLFTSHIGTCSVIMFHLNDFNFMGHIDAMQNNKNQIIHFIKQHFKTDNTYIEAIIIKGPWCSDKCKSFEITLTSLNDLGINYKIYPYKIDWTKTIYFNKQLSIV